MTIKQQGGVFGRNPTFNNVEVDGTATLDNIASGTKLRVTASQNPAAYLEFENTFQNAGIASQAGLLLGVNSSVQTNYAGVIATEQATNSNGVLLGLYANNGAGPILVAQARNNKNFEIVDGDLVVASGHGIDFSATSGTGTSELFDDYEEGTWTATVGCTGNATTTTTVTAYYTKIGRQVTVGFRLLNNIDTTGLTGFFQIGGLPYACITGSTAGFAGIADWSDLTYPAGVDTVIPTVTNGSSGIIFSTRGSGIAGGLLGATQPTSGVTDIAHFALTYFTA